MTYTDPKRDAVVARMKSAMDSLRERDRAAMEKAKLDSPEIAALLQDRIADATNTIFGMLFSGGAPLVLPEWDPSRRRGPLLDVETLDPLGTEDQ